MAQQNGHGRCGFCVQQKVLHLLHADADAVPGQSPGKRGNEILLRQVHRRQTGLLFRHKNSPFQREKGPRSPLPRLSPLSMCFLFGFYLPSNPAFSSSRTACTSGIMLSTKAVHCASTSPPPTTISVVFSLNLVLMSGPRVE